MAAASGMNGHSTALETPASLFGRLRLGREEFCQRLLTSLILEGGYPRWNTRSRACDRGTAFLRDLYVLSFGGGWPGDDFWFIDEFELPARVEEEKGGYPDYALLWDNRLWIIELKTERQSHRADQIPYYFELAHHHHPSCAIDLTYLTGPRSKSGAATQPWERFSHLEWSAISPMIVQHWGDATDLGQDEVVRGLTATIEGLDQPATRWRSIAATIYETEPAPRSADMDPTARALELAQQTAEDGEQRALDVPLGSLDALHELRMRVRSELAATAAGDPLRRVLPWVWRAESSGGRVKTTAGEEAGFELRLSRYEKPRYG